MTEELDWDLEERDEFIKTEHPEPETEVLVGADE